MRWLKRLPASRVISVAAVLTLIVLVTWVGIILIIWKLGGPANDSWDLWGMLEGLSSAAAFATVIGGGVVVLAQLVESVDSRSMTVYNSIFEKLMSDEDIDARRWIYSHLPSDPEVGMRSLDARGHAAIKRTLNSFDHLGFLLKQDWVTDDAIVEWVSPIVNKTWVKLEPYINYEIQRRNEPEYYASARYLADRCRKYRKDVVWVKDAL